MELAINNHCLHCGAPSDGVKYCCSACELLDTLKGPLDLAPANPYSYLDQDDFQKLYQHPAQSELPYIIYCQGLHCSSCVHLLEKLPEFCEDVVEARVHFGRSTVSIKLREGGSLARAVQSIAELGYTPTPLSTEDSLESKYQKENRTALKRIAIAGFCAGNTMLFVIPVYAGLAGTWAQTFNFMSLLLFLPILFYSAQPFYQGAWNSLKYKVINVDLPIAIAMLTGFALSCVNLVRGDGKVYFDSTASFMFFILCARYLLKRVQQSYLSPQQASSLFRNEKYQRLNAGQSETIPWKDVKENDILIINQGQNFPADCELLSSSAAVDMSLFNGESLPKVFTQGLTVFAGTKLIDTSAHVRVASTIENSKLGELFNELNRENAQKSRFASLTDRLAQKLIATVFGLAILFFAIYSFVDVTEAFQRSLALIVLACPCALAFGTPLTLGLALKQGQKKGILLKNANSLEKLLYARNIFFDKTGTLTEGTLHLREESLSDDLKAAILTLESKSYHPVAFALRKAWRDITPLKNLTNYEEVLGQGVRGSIDGNLYEVRNLSESTHDSVLAVEVFKNSRSVARLYFTDQLREDSANLIQNLQQKNINCYILSGDKAAEVKNIANACGIPLANCHSELFPEDKRNIIQSYPHSVMLGDGANDSLSLKSATVGIAVKGSVDLSLQNADIYFSKSGLAPLLELLNLSIKTRQILVRNLAISLIYNSVGGTLALLGFINPMTAAILMPISSAIIIISSLWGFR